jgi:zinc/manganese transport system ATP-binding protein
MAGNQAAERISSNSAYALELEGVGRQFGALVALADVNLRVGAGERRAVLGSNGAGKTTLFRAILGLQQLSAGSVRVAGGSVGYVPQKFLLDPDMPLRGRDLVGLGLDGHKLGLPIGGANRRERIDQMLDAVDARGFADGRVGLLSGGEQQRILIAHALISRPQLLLLDEPLANLDLRSAQEVVSLLARIAREREIAVLISAHEMNPLLPAIDRVVYLADGRAASGTADEVIRSSVLSELYGHHVDVLRVHGRVIVVAGTGLDEHPPPGAESEPVEIV